MLFNSINFIFIFLPIVLIIYFGLNKLKLVRIATGWLVLASLFFYSYWSLDYLALILTSIIFNYAIGQTLLSNKLKINKKALTAFGIVGNVLLLIYFKYFNFLIANINAVLHQHFNFMELMLPLAISFFTFQQIAYLVDTYKGKTKEIDFLTYALFVCFFPHLISGPIVRYEEEVPQIQNLRKRFINWKNLSKGLFLFSVGLFKKVVIADLLAKWALTGFSDASNLSMLESWITILSYTFQIFFDFSGYTDMALGIGLMFNFDIAQNFNNPYISKDIQEFWRRWHMTLSRWLRDYLYIPLGGNRHGNFNTYKNIFLTFLIGGIWHGASWTYIVWGILHGIGSVINRIWKNVNGNIPNWSAWLLTFVYINITWTYFGAKRVTDANQILLSAVNPLTFDIPRIYFPVIKFRATGHSFDLLALILIPIFIYFIFSDKFRKLIDNFKPQLSYSIFIVTLMVISIYNLLKPDYASSFIYFNF